MELQRAGVAVVPADDATPAGLLDQTALHSPAASADVLTPAALAAVAATRADADPRREAVMRALSDHDRLSARRAGGTPSANGHQAVAPKLSLIHI